ncbi:MAG: TonB-dependent receptor [Pseudomonadota bacterium]
MKSGPNPCPVSLRANVSFFDSKVDQVPGPNNRLEGQAKGTANVGADYRLRGLPVRMGFGVNYTPAYDLQISDIQSSSVGAKVVKDAFVLWFINSNTQLRLSANPSPIRWGMRLELKL